MVKSHLMLRGFLQLAILLVAAIAAVEAEAAAEVPHQRQSTLTGEVSDQSEEKTAVVLIGATFEEKNDEGATSELTAGFVDTPTEDEHQLELDFRVGYDGDSIGPFLAYDASGLSAQVVGPLELFTEPMPPGTCEWEHEFSFSDQKPAQPVENMHLPLMS